MDGQIARVLLSIHHVPSPLRSCQGRQALGGPGLRPQAGFPEGGILRRQFWIQFAFVNKTFELILIDKSVGPQESGQRAAMQCAIFPPSPRKMRNPSAWIPEQMLINQHAQERTAFFCRRRGISSLLSQRRTLVTCQWCTNSTPLQGEKQVAPRRSRPTITRSEMYHFGENTC